MNLNRNFTAVAIICMVFINMENAFSSTDQFDFKKYLFGEPTLALNLDSVDQVYGKVIINGVDMKAIAPFDFDWGDGTFSSGYFPQNHIYNNMSKNYLVKVVAHYPENNTDREEIVVRFTTPQINKQLLPSITIVKIPDYSMKLTDRIGNITHSNLTYFDDSFFDKIPRSAIEYVLSIVAAIQMDFVNDNVFELNDDFQQFMLRDSTANFMYSLWFTSPVSFGVGDYGFREPIQWSSFTHEMGHNFTLNTPSNYYYGGKIDGNANAIFSESMAQIFQHATAYELINNYRQYGLSDDIIMEIKASAISSIRIVKSAYNSYIRNGMKFHSWNDPSTDYDDTVGTFMTIAYKFFEYAEKERLGYRIPVKRMLLLLQLFDEELMKKYDQLNNTKEAEKFRSTLMITALSFAFLKDFRGDFLNLSFPIDDKIYDELYEKASASMAEKENLESPQQDSFESGVGLIRGWVCQAERVEVQIDDGPRRAVAYGTTRGDTIEVCGDSNNGFGLTFNWNALVTGKHRLRAFADAVQFADVTFNVTTLGVDFLKGVSGEYTLPDFPKSNQSVTIKWSEPHQNFVISGVSYNSVRISSNTIVPLTASPAYLESPQQDSFESGVGLIRGWVCQAERVEVQIDDGPRRAVAYGTTRGDTIEVCGDNNNGFGLTFNWNALGTGKHRLRAFANAVQFADITFNVTTLGVDFLRGVSGQYTLPNFPFSKQNVMVSWAEPHQNFVIVGFSK